MAAPIAPSALAPPPLADRLDRALQATADPEARRVLSALIAWKQEKSAANTAALDRAASLGETPTASPTPAAVDQDGPAGPSSAMIRSQLRDFRRASHGLAPVVACLPPPRSTAATAVTPVATDEKLRLTNRMYEIQQLMSTPLPTMVVDSLKREQRGLRLAAHQARLRAAIRQRGAAAVMEVAADPADWRFPKATTTATAMGGTGAGAPTLSAQLQEVRRAERAKRKKARHAEFLAAVGESRGHLIARAEAQRAARANLNAAVMRWHDNSELRAQRKRQEEEAAAVEEERERMRLLKANDEAGYRRLILSARNERLARILKETDNFMKDFLEKIAVQQAQAPMAVPLSRDQRRAQARAERERKKREEEEEAAAKAARIAEGADEDDDAFAGLDQAAVDLSVAHAITEAVVQPSILVGGTLKPYQLTGLRWMVSLYNNHLNGILADEMGLGKTIQTLALVSYLAEFKANRGPHLIVVPLSTVSNWVQEMVRWTPSLTHVAFKGNKDTRARLFDTMIKPGKCNVCITTFEYVVREATRLKTVSWQYIIVDEGHRLKNAKSKLAESLRIYSCVRKLILTGTPLQNNLQELWALLNFLVPSVFDTVDSFDSWFNTPFEQMGERIKVSEEEKLLVIRRLHQVLRPFLLRRLKTDVEAQLPSKVERTLKCQLSAYQRVMYDQLRRKGALKMREVGSKTSLNNTLMQLRKICNHPYLFPEADAPYTNAEIVRVSGKFELLDRVLPKLKATGHRVLLFSQMTALLTVLEDYMSWRGHTYLRLDGSTKQSTRGALLRKFNAPDSPFFVFLLSTRAGGLGLNLQTADTVILFDSDWNPHADLQAQDRAHRIGQKHEVRVLRLMCANTIEEHVLERAGFKRAMDDMVIEAGMFNTKAKDGERRQLLRDLLRDDDSDDDLSEIPTDKEINELLARSPAELRLFADIDRRETAAGVRLGTMTVEELPDWLLANAEESESVDDTAVYGRGRRSRKSVNYTDGLSEIQFERLLQHGVDVEDPDALAKAVAKINGRKRRHGSDDDDGYDDDPDDDVTGSVFGASDSEMSGDGGGGGGGGGKRQKKSATPREPQVWETGVANQALLIPLLGVLDRLVQVTDPETGRALADVFLSLPSPADLPQYYNVIDVPLDFDKVRSRLLLHGFATVNAFRAMLDRMFDNAMTYNQPGSQVYADAEALKAHAHALCAALTGEAPPAMVQNLLLAAAAGGNGDPTGNRKRLRSAVDDDESEADDDDDDVLVSPRSLDSDESEGSDDDEPPAKRAKME